MIHISCDRRGPSGAPLLVLLPPLGGSGDLFDRFREDLAQDHHVLTCEPPGSGDSSSPPGVPSTRSLAHGVIQVLEKLAAPRAHLFGISLGGMVAQWIAIDAPGRLDRLILASTTARGLSIVRGADLGALAMARCLLMPGNAALKLVREVVSDEALADPEEAARIEDAVRAHPRGRYDLLWLSAAAASHDTRAELAGIAAPTLVLMGADDELVPCALQRELADAIEGAASETVSGAAHDLTLDQPHRTAELVRAFLAEK